MPFTEEQVLEELRAQGITTIEELAQRVAKQSAAVAQFSEEMDFRGEERETDYIWSGKNYSLYHPE
jgi:hypothetical protein